MDKVREERTQLSEKQANRVLAQRPFSAQVVRQVPAIAVLHDEVDVSGRLPTLEQRDDIFMMEFREFLEDGDFLGEEGLGLGQVLLRDGFYGHALSSLKEIHSS